MDSTLLSFAGQSNKWNTADDGEKNVTSIFICLIIYTLIHFARLMPNVRACCMQCHAFSMERFNR